LQYSVTGINVFLDQPNSTKGTLLCTIKGSELSAVRAWETIRKMINLPVTGIHNVYFVATGSGETSINWWQFQSLNEVFADLSNGSGALTASFESSELATLTDDDLTTAFTANIESGAETWIQYQCPSPMRLYGYQLFSGNNDEGNPKGWTLQASNDGKQWEVLHTEPDTTFVVQGQCYRVNVNTSKDYTHYRLLFNCHDTQTQLSVSEWQLLGRYIDENDLTADGGTITEGYETLTDHIGTTYVNTPVSAVYHTA
jgi:hypothetical protein